MCFGNQVQTEQKTTNTTLPSYLSDAAQKNVANAGAVTSTPYQPYTGEMTAPLSANQNTATSMIQGAAATPNPYTGQAADAYSNLTTAPAQSISAPSILGGGTDVNNSTISDYMNPYIQAALNPTLQAISRQGDAARKTIGASSTMSGAFGDARQGVETANQMRDEQQNVGNTVGSAYNAAFNTAAGLRGTDINNSMAVQNANAGYNETALARAATGATDLTNLDKYNTGRTVDLANALNSQGAQAQNTQQAADTANLTAYLRQQGYPAQMIQLMTQTLAGTPHDTSQQATTMKPDNSGYGILGSLAGPALQIGLAAATGGASVPLSLAASGAGAMSAGNAGGTGGSLGGLY